MASRDYTDETRACRKDPVSVRPSHYDDTGLKMLPRTKLDRKQSQQRAKHTKLNVNSKQTGKISDSSTIPGLSLLCARGLGELLGPDSNRRDMRQRGVRTCGQSCLCVRSCVCLFFLSSFLLFSFFSAWSDLQVIVTTQQRGFLWRAAQSQLSTVY